MIDKAEAGMKANFVFASGKTVFGVIEYVPVATGDCWVVTEVSEGKKQGVVYIQQFDMMFLRS